MEPILVSFNKIQYDSDVARLTHACQLLSGKLAQIEEIAAIKLTPEMVSELLYANEPTITETAIIVPSAFFLFLRVTLIAFCFLLVDFQNQGMKNSI
ncbi:hypothetical protein [Niabella drilacis]|uniref:Uncharacterized protein n=1 Tax=Niabella drilacis (strain DSM 25811 / CCM 8410 / CCUG 62505 / LMG 26954 / E90) TaxID=1285928 RepID=A0A1G6X192_NIADE|nr:hypothetical protein [Niabella drilacis]SDD71076.1 hypothetical protein SAMN04487894_11279 [Niabella drilacis]